MEAWKITKIKLQTQMLMNDKLPLFFLHVNSFRLKILYYSLRYFRKFTVKVKEDIF